MEGQSSAHPSHLHGHHTFHSKAQHPQRHHFPLLFYCPKWSATTLLHTPSLLLLSSQVLGQRFIHEDEKGEQLPEADFLALAFHKPSFPSLTGFPPLAFPSSGPREHTAIGALLWSIGEILEKVHGKWKMEIINATLPRKAEDRTLYISSL